MGSLNYKNVWSCFTETSFLHTSIFLQYDLLFRCFLPFNDCYLWQSPQVFASIFVYSTIILDGNLFCTIKVYVNLSVLILTFWRLLPIYFLFLLFNFSIFTEVQSYLIYFVKMFFVQISNKLPLRFSNCIFFVT